MKFQSHSAVKEVKSSDCSNVQGNTECIISLPSNQPNCCCLPCPWNRELCSPSSRKSVKVSTAALRSSESLGLSSLHTTSFPRHFFANFSSVRRWVVSSSADRLLVQILWILKGPGGAKYSSEDGCLAFPLDLPSHPFNRRNRNKRSYALGTRNNQPWTQNSECARRFRKSNFLQTRREFAISEIDSYVTSVVLSLVITLRAMIGLLLNLTDGGTALCREPMEGNLFPGKLTNKQWVYFLVNTFLLAHAPNDYIVIFASELETRWYRI